MTVDSINSLVLEGGGMRGVFTSGALDYLMDQNIHIPYVIAVSAGACNGLSYISRQRGRAKYSNIDLMEKYNYISMSHFVRKRNLLDFDLLFEQFPETILPFDYDTFFSSSQRFVMVTTNCLTGEAMYLEERKEKQRLLDICKASSSLPIACPITFVDQIPMLDGGLVDSIPILQAIKERSGHHLVILTRNAGYRKKGKDRKIPSFIYKKYPAIREVLGKRNSLYNAQLELIDHLEEEGKITVIRPESPVTVDRIEKDIRKLTTFYEEGYACAKKVFEQQLKYQ